jgi:hypothetical protein
MSFQHIVESFIGKNVSISINGVFYRGKLLDAGNDYLKINVSKSEKEDHIRFYNLNNIDYIAEYSAQNNNAGQYDATIV